jgi:hypothetical protein
LQAIESAVPNPVLELKKENGSIDLQGRPAGRPYCISLQDQNLWNDVRYVRHDMQANRNATGAKPTCMHWLTSNRAQRHIFARQSIWQRQVIITTCFTMPDAPGRFIEHRLP